MALITCSECGGKMSDRATECPHCGCPIEIAKCDEVKDEAVSSSLTPQVPQKRTMKWKIALIVMSVIVLIGTGAILCFKNDVFASSTLKITPEFTDALQIYRCSTEV